MRPERPTLRAARRLLGNLDARETSGASIPVSGPLTHTPSPRLAPVAPWPSSARSMARRTRAFRTVRMGKVPDDHRPFGRSKKGHKWKIFTSIIGKGGHDKYLAGQVGVSTAYQAKC